MEPFSKSAAIQLQCGDHVLDLSRPIIMGVLNVTPDSFSDGGQCLQPEAALRRAHQMVEAGAGIIDIGGESTRPGAAEVDVNDELGRVIPLVEKLAPQLPVPISVDTSKPEVMAAAASAGAGMINDVYALRREYALATAAAVDIPICLMHMQGEPRTMQQQPDYVDVFAEVRNFLVERLQQCVHAGISEERILFDPGFGFGKTLEHNVELFRRLHDLAGLGLPLLVGLSRKSMIGQITGREVDQRVHGSVAAAMLAVLRGAHIVRVHDVAATRDALEVLAALR